MKYISTRGNYRAVNGAEAIRLGMVPTGGLFVPEEIPVLSSDEIYKMKDLQYSEIVYQVLEPYLTDYSPEELRECINSAYNSDNFKHKDIAPLIKLTDNTYILELWHGPTAAFKDLALQLMPYLLVKAINKSVINKEIVILVATSGDTGKAALEGFKDIPGIRIIVFYPHNGVSKIQEQQMITTDGSNTTVVAVKGNFDDCQNAVKEIFADQEFNQQVNQHGYQFSSANSINWGRLVPQIAYYFATYAYLLREGELTPGKKINLTVPTGNFGNILAAYYAYRMGLPVNKFICASNINKVLTDFIQTGIYNTEREFQQTISPSMDILISSNLERFLFEITDHDADKINQWYLQLKQEGRFIIDEETSNNINRLFIGEYATEDETRASIRETYQKYNYLVDTHTAVGLNVYRKYINKTGDQNSVIIDATANPYKFARAVLEALYGIADEEDEFALINRLNKLTNMEIHQGLKGLKEKAIRHNRICTTNKIKDEIKDILNIF